VPHAQRPGRKGPAPRIAAAGATAFPLSHLLEQLPQETYEQLGQVLGRLIAQRLLSLADGKAGSHENG
jgi:hypothetical protein